MTDFPMTPCESCGGESYPVSEEPDGPASCGHCGHKPAIPLGPDGLPDIRVMGCKKKPGRHNIGMSAKAAVDYLDVKLRLLELDSPLNHALSDSAMIELLVYCANHGVKAMTVLFSGWRPETKDSRRAENIPVSNVAYKHAKQRTKELTLRINDTIKRRKEVTYDRLQFFRAYPEAARTRKRALCQRARLKDLAAGDPVRRRDGGLPDPGDQE